MSKDGLNRMEFEISELAKGSVLTSFQKIETQLRSL